MSVFSRKTPFLLLVGDIAAFVLALWLTVYVRYSGVPYAPTFVDHIVPFAFLFVIWAVIYFISGLYERHAVILRNALPQVLVQAQLVNIGVAAMFFYFVPITGITPKTNLAIYLVISLVLVVIWRLYLYRMLVPERKEDAVIIGSGAEMEELKRQVNGNPSYNMRFVSSVDIESPQSVDFQGDVLAKIYQDGVSLIVIDLDNDKVQAILPQLYNLLFSRVRFVDMHKVYEDIFDRVALSLLSHSWFLENISAYPKYVYDALKRMMDFIIAFPLGVISLVFYPFVYIAVKLDDGGPVFIMQERVGKDNKIIRIPKFRTMRTSDKGIWVKEHDDRITRVGSFLRKSRIDELPQLYSVIKGDMSLVGPRPDIYDLGMKLSKEIPYYTVRNIIKPGLSGWAQTRQKLPPQSLEETKVRLAYDFYYIKHRSLLIDLKIALQTIATLVSRAGK
ncbi:MAG: exopolysaccharide biosynthesis polyprenyl glycosylphosphotransferase [Candidatus Paceibacterota bacterium]